MDKRAIVITVLVLLLTVVACGCVSSSKYEDLQRYSENISIELTKAKNELMASEAKINELSVQSKSLSEELTSINAKYPPRHFTSYEELNNWMGQHQKEWTDDYDEQLNIAVEMQYEALIDGYTMSVFLGEGDLTLPKDSLFPWLATIIISDGQIIWVCLSPYSDMGIRYPPVKQIKRG